MDVAPDPAARREAAKAAPLFELRGISKRFPGVQALDEVSFEIARGEVHMLLGENGAGKSTLMKVLCGAYRANSGELFHDGQPVDIASPADARRLGISVIFQEFTLVPYLDIAQNIFLGREFRGRVPGFVDRKRLYSEARRMLDLMGFAIDPHTPVHTLGVAQQQMVEIAKALSQNARILVMDEPTAALSDRETERLFAIIGRLRRDGVAIVYISHRLAEVFALGDRITVLRDGRKIASVRPAETSPDDLVRLMVGRAVDRTYAREYCNSPGELLLEVKGLASDNGVADVSLAVRAGEIVGLCGLVGSGRTEVARAIFGADRVTAGEIRLKGESIAGSPEELRAARHGADPGEPQAAGTGAEPFGRRQHRAGKPAQDVSLGDIPAWPRRQGGTRRHRAAAHRDAGPEPAGVGALRRQPAESRRRKVARRRCARVHLR